MSDMHIHMYDSINLWQTYNMYVSVDVTDIHICILVLIYDIHALMYASVSYMYGSINV